jgi:hypothetical protein
MHESPAQGLYLTLKRIHPSTIKANVIGQFIRTIKTTRIIEGSEERETTTVNLSEVIGWGLWPGGLALSFNPGWPSTTEVLRDGLAGAGLQMNGEDIKGEGLTRSNDDIVPTGTGEEEVRNKMKYLRPVSGVSVYFDCGPLGQFVEYTDESGNCTLTIPSLFTGKIRSVTATAVFQEVRAKALFSLPYAP